MESKTIKCLLCNSKDSRLLIDKDRNEKKVNNFICDKCGFVFIYPRIDDTKSYYQKGTFSLEARGSIIPNESKIKMSEKSAYLRMLILEKECPTIFNDSANFNLLEIGCGIGSFLRLGSHLNWNVKGIEPDISYSQFGSDYYNIEITSQLFEEYKTKIKYDLVATFHTIEHVLDPIKFVKHIYHVLNDDGILYLECPTLDHMYGKSKYHFFWDAHINSFSNKTIEYLLVSAGFKLIKKQIFNSAISIIAKKTKIVQSVTSIFDSSTRIEQIVSNYKRNSLKLKLKNFQTILLLRLFENKNNLLIKSKALILQRTIKKAKIKSGHLNFIHIAHQTKGNSGDTVLVEMVRKTFHVHLNDKINFIKIHTHHEVTKSTVEFFNKCDGIIIGGGGLLLKGTNDNTISGWQWPCSVELLQTIKTPIYVFAIGYNKFRNQENFENIFHKNISLLVEKSHFFGLRNHGSINAFNTNPNKNKISYQPCPTTIISNLYSLDIKKRLKRKKIIAINIALDRPRNRFGSQEKNIINRILDAADIISDLGYKIIYTFHTGVDRHLRYFLHNRTNSNYIDMTYYSFKKVLKFYNACDIVIGMRGHAQMIPFGLGVPIFSLISHNKLAYFLDDIGHPEWGIEVTDPNLKEILVDFVTNIDYEYNLSENKRIRTILSNQTKNNFKKIKSRHEN